MSTKQDNLKQQEKQAVSEKEYFNCSWLQSNLSLIKDKNRNSSIQRHLSSLPFRQNLLIQSVFRILNTLLFHINAFHSQYLSCDVWTFRTKVQVPSGSLCNSSTVLRFDIRAQRFFTICPVKSSRTVLTFLPRKTALNRVQKSVEIVLLYHTMNIISHT